MPLVWLLSSQEYLPLMTMSFSFVSLTIFGPHICMSEDLGKCDIARIEASFCSCLTDDMSNNVTGGVVSQLILKAK